MSEPSPANNDAGRTIAKVLQLRSDWNPYLHNVFTLLGIDPDQGERAVRSKVRLLERRLEAGQPLQAHGKNIEPADLARAVYVTGHVDEYIAERLMAHTSHKVDLAAFDQPMQDIEAIVFDSAEQRLPLPIHDLSVLTRLLPPAATDVEQPQPLSSNILIELAAQEVAAERVFDI